MIDNILIKSVVKNNSISQCDQNLNCKNSCDDSENSLIHLFVCKATQCPVCVTHLLTES